MDGCVFGCRPRVLTPVDAIVRRRRELGFDWWIWDYQVRECLWRLYWRIHAQLEAIRIKTLDCSSREIFEVRMYDRDLGFKETLWAKVLAKSATRRESLKDVLLALTNAAGQGLYMRFAFPEVVVMETRESWFRCVVELQTLPISLRNDLRVRQLVESR